MKISIFIFALVFSFRSISVATCESDRASTIQNLINNAAASSGCDTNTPPNQICWTYSIVLIPISANGATYSKVDQMQYVTGPFPGTNVYHFGVISDCSSGYNSAANSSSFRIEKSEKACGSIVEVENQTLAERVPIVGASFDMLYSSGYTKGRIGDFTASVALSKATPRDHILSFDVEVFRGATSVDTASYSNSTANQTYTYTWDGLDLSSNESIGSEYFKVVVKEISSTATVPVTTNLYLGHFNAKLLGLGGWVPSNYKFYDQNRKAIYGGDGSYRAVSAKAWNTTGFYASSKNGDEVYYFDSSGRHIYTKTGLTGTTVLTFAYDGLGRLVSVAEPFSKVTTFERDLSGVLESITAPNGQVTDVTIDGNGYISEIKNPKNESYTMAYYGTDGLLYTFTKPEGHTSTFTYDADGKLTKDEHSGGYFFEILNTLNGLSYKKTTAMGRQTAYAISKSDTTYGRNTTLPNTLTQAYNLDKDSKTESENPTPVSTINTTYADDSRFGSMSRFRTSSAFLSGSISYTVSNSQSVTLSNSNDPFSITAYTLTSTNGSLVTTTQYDPTTKTFDISTSLGRTAQTKIDSYERSIYQQIGGLYPVELTYTDDKLTKIKQNARETDLAYNSTTGFLATITNPLSEVTGFTYDSAGRLASKVLPDLRVVAYGHDANGNVSSITPPNRPVHSFGMNAQELPSSYEPPTLSGVTTVNTTYSYNLDKQLTQVLRPTGDSISFVYSSTSGALDTMTVPSNTFTYYRSWANGRPYFINATTGPAMSISYSGDIPTEIITYASTSSPRISSFGFSLSSKGLVTSTAVAGAYGTSSISYTYDNDELLTGAGDLTLAKDTPNGMLTATSIGTTPNIVTDAYTYNSFGEVTGYQAKYGTTVIYDLALGRDGMGRINSKTQTMNSVTDTYGYTFDSTGRLTQTDKNSSTVATYGYDDNSNRDSGTIGSQPTTATYDDQDRMTAYNLLTFTYNANGDLTSKTNTLTSTTTSYVYDVFGNLTSVTLPSSDVVTYEIDGLNRRIGKKLNGVLQARWVYMDQTRIAAELDSSGNIAKRFVYASKSNIPDYMIMGGENYRIISDQLGSPRLVVKVSDGTVAGRMDHDEYGRVAVNTNPGLLPFGFAGGLYDTDTGLVRFGARDYDPETGRWTSKDPSLFAGGINLYGYSFNDPVNFIDSNGKNPLLIAVGAGAIVGGAASFTGTLLAGGSIKDGIASIPGGSLAGAAATITTLGAIAGGAVTGVAVGTGVVVDLLITAATTPDVLPPGSIQDFSNGIHPPKRSCP
jgi:RHS repeat-associated protein